MNQRKKDRTFETKYAEFSSLMFDKSLKESTQTLQSLMERVPISVLHSQKSWCSSKRLQCITRQNNFKSFPLVQGNKFYQHEHYLSGRIHRGPSSQQLLNQAHMALLGSQMESVESILKREANSPQKLSNSCGQYLIFMQVFNPETRQTLVSSLYFFFLHQFEATKFRETNFQCF